MVFVIVMGICALIMFGIGIFQMTGKTPVTFYTGEKAPDVGTVRDLSAWNKKHGMAWVVYGVAIVMGIIAGVIIQDTIAFTVIECVCIFAPLPLMALYHKKLVREYIKN